MALLLTLLRCILILPFAAAFYIDASWAMPAALGIFLVAAATDYLDGWVARARAETSALGAALDPLADKLLIAAALLLLVKTGVIAGYETLAALAILLRELLVGGLREAAGAAALPVSRLGKAKTVLQAAAATLLLADAPGGLLDGRLGPAPDVILWAAAVLTIASGADYAARATALLRRKTP